MREKGPLAVCESFSLLAPTGIPCRVLCSCEEEPGPFAEDYSMRITKQMLTAVFPSSSWLLASHLWIDPTSAHFYLLLNRGCCGKKKKKKSVFLNFYIIYTSGWLKTIKQKVVEVGQRWLCALGYCTCCMKVAPASKSPRTSDWENFWADISARQVHQDVNMISRTYFSVSGTGYTILLLTHLNLK